MNVEVPDLSGILPALLAAVPFALLIILGAVLLNLVMSRGLVTLANRTSFTHEQLVPFRRIIKWSITIAALVLIFGAFGLNVGGMWGVLSTVLAMIAIGFVAVWSVLSNTLCTLLIMIFRPFSIGDEIEFAGEAVKGRVVDLNFIYTTLDTGEGSVMQVPNNLFFQKVLRRRTTTTAVSPAAHMQAKQADQPDARSMPAGVPSATQS
jgi:small-conductance mechanosensitive channel